jgi:hypothetical protein
VCGLIFYAAGIATNFFASPIFSIFWIISYQTAHNIVTYVAVAAAAALTITALSISLIKKPKPVFLEMHNLTVIRILKAPNESIRILKAPNESSVSVAQSANNQKITNNSESDKKEQKARAYSLLIVSDESTNGAVADNLVVEDLKNRKIEVRLPGKSFYPVEHVQLQLSDEEVNSIMHHNPR